MKKLLLVCGLIFSLAGCQVVPRAVTVCPETVEIPPNLSVTPEASFTDELAKLWLSETDVTNSR